MGEMLLPVEIMTGILARLPMRSILRLRSVSKTWRDTIDTQLSAMLHLERDIAPGKRLPTCFFLRPDDRLDDLAVYLVEQEEEDVLLFKATKINLALPQVISRLNTLSVLAARGLFSVCYYGPSTGQFFPGRGPLYHLICNPFTGQFLQLPVILSQDLLQGEVTCGFGYDSSTGKFKVLRIYLCCLTKEIEALVFTLGSNVWKKVEGYPQGQGPASKSVSVANTLHWLCHDASILLTFDLVSETFGSIQLPESRSSSYPGILCDVNGCLSIADGYFEDWVEMWVMKDHGVVESWTKLVMFRGPLENGDWDSLLPFQPISFLNENELLLLSHRDTLVLHNFESGIRTRLHVRDMPQGQCFEASPYCGNLLSFQPLQ